MSDDCVFCKIVSKEIPSLAIYEDADLYAFLDIHPVSKGHTLVIPKSHYADIRDLPPSLEARIAQVAQKLSLEYISKLQATGINLLHASGVDAQQSVPHFHMHVVPRYPSDGLDLWFHKQANERIDITKVYQTIKGTP